MKTLAERAAYLLGLIGNSTKDLARIAGVKPPSVSQWVSGQTKSIQIEPATRLAKHFGMNPLWVSKGIPPMLDERMDHFYGWILQGLAISYFIGLMLDTNNQ